MALPSLWAGGERGPLHRPLGRALPVLHTTQGQGPDWKKARTRHLGGSNIGWADGHASWIAAQRLCAMSDDREIEGVGLICPDFTTVEGYLQNCGGLEPGMDFLFTRHADWQGN